MADCNQVAKRIFHSHRSGDRVSQEISALDFLFLSAGPFHVFLQRRNSVNLADLPVILDLRDDADLLSLLICTCIYIGKGFVGVEKGYRNAVRCNHVRGVQNPLSCNRIVRGASAEHRNASDDLRDSLQIEFLFTRRGYHEEIIRSAVLSGVFHRLDCDLVACRPCVTLFWRSRDSDGHVRIPHRHDSYESVVSGHKALICNDSRKGSVADQRYPGKLFTDRSQQCLCVILNAAVNERHLRVLNRLYCSRSFFSRQFRAGVHTCSGFCTQHIDPSNLIFRNSLFV